MAAAVSSCSPYLETGILVIVLKYGRDNTASTAQNSDVWVYKRK